MKINTILFLITGTILAVSNYLALHLFLYWRYSWIDMPVHFIGGATAALGLFVLYDFRLPLPRRFLSWQPLMIFVFVVVITWEVFEVLLGAADTSATYYISDTITDIILGSLGGIVCWFIGTKVRELETLID